MTNSEVISVVSIVFSFLGPIVTFLILQSFKREEFVFSEGQFKNYNSLWIMLCDLEISADRLWENGVTEKNLKQFILAVEKADRAIRESALLLDRTHLDGLTQILATLKDYQVGKEKLLVMENINEHATRQIQTRIDGNFDLLGRYKKLKEEILKAMRAKLCIE